MEPRTLPAKIAALEYGGAFVQFVFLGDSKKEALVARTKSKGRLWIIVCDFSFLLCAKPKNNDLSTLHFKRQEKWLGM